MVFVIDIWISPDISVTTHGTSMRNGTDDVPSSKPLTSNRVFLQQCNLPLPWSQKRISAQPFYFFLFQDYSTPPSILALPVFPLMKHVESSGDHLSQLNPPDLLLSMCDDCVTSHFCAVARLTQICHRICQPRQPKVAPANVRASAKWGFCRHRARRRQRFHGGRSEHRAEFTTPDICHKK